MEVMSRVELRGRGDSLVSMTGAIRGAAVWSQRGCDKSEFMVGREIRCHTCADQYTWWQVKTMSWHDAISTIRDFSRTPAKTSADLDTQVSTTSIPKQ